MCNNVTDARPFTWGFSNSRRNATRKLTGRAYSTGTFGIVRLHTAYGARREVRREKNESNVGRDQQTQFTTAKGTEYAKIRTESRECATRGSLVSRNQTTVMIVGSAQHK